MIKTLTDKIKDYVTTWRATHADSPGLFYVVAIVIGLLSGMGAAALKGGIGFVMHLLFGALNIHEGNWVFLLMPLLGIMITMIYVRYLVKQPLDHASERIADAIAKGDGTLRPKVIWGSIISCSLTLGMGGSAGAESPIAYTGAAIGSNIGRIFGLTKQEIVNLVGCGAAAGIGGIYMAPIGGVMFAFEILRMPQTLRTALGVTFSSLVSALTCYILLGCHTDVSFVPEMRFDTHLIPLVMGCGVLCGLYSLYYRKALKFSRKFYAGIANPWFRALSGGLLMSAVLFVFPSLYGEGYGIIGKLMDNDPTSIISYGPLYELGSRHFLLLMIFFVVLLLFKPFATGTTNDSGGVGGDFTPTFFCGAVAGFLFAAVFNHYFHMQLPYALFAFFGMAAVMSGSQYAPLMAIFIAAEMTGMYGFILPLTIAALTSYVTTVLLGYVKIFKADNVRKPMP